MRETLDPNINIFRYRIVSKIGEGGMVEVFLAQDRKLDRQVGLKSLFKFSFLRGESGKKKVARLGISFRAEKAKRSSLRIFNARMVFSYSRGCTSGYFLKRAFSATLKNLNRL